MFKPLLLSLPLLSQAQAAPIEPPMVHVPAGAFRMGGETQAANALPVHTVRVPAFRLGKYEVTVREFRQFVEATGHEAPQRCNHQPGPNWFAGPTAGSWDRNALGDGEYQPVACIGWTDANAYAKWLSAQTGKSYRLPTEAEWEYAARAGQASIYPFGADANQVCAYANLSDRTGEFAAQSRFGASYIGFMGGHLSCDDGAGFASIVGLYKPNAWGLHDMIGNASEYLQDCWTDNYEGAPADGSARLDGDCNKRVVRGGSWHWRDVSASGRGAAPLDRVGAIEGFRLAQSLERPADHGPAAAGQAFERELQQAQAAERVRRRQRMAFPAEPRGLKLQQDGGAMRLSWTANAEPGITGYHVFRSDSLGGPLRRIASDVQGLGYVDRNAPARKHSYALAAVNRDVFGAYGESVSSADTTHALPGLIQAEDFNAMAQASMGRINPQEDAEEPAGGLNLTGPTGVAKGSWTEYGISVPRAGRYQLQLRYAALRDSQGLRLSVDGEALATQDFKSTGGPRVWQTLSGPTVTLPAGMHVLRVAALDDGWKLNWLRLDWLEAQAR